MCMFTYVNKSSRTAFVKGVEKFECGSCPECLQKKSRKWALRCAMEAKDSPGVMVTLTYDTYKEGSTIEENPVDSSLHVNKKHCQDFIKRLRKHFPNQRIKYLLTAEYGKKTHRAHYHALLFNVSFNDLIQYKKSKRNNIIYKSQTLEKIWSHGICTVDCINLSAKTARYCTKYCAKDAGVDDTFMLFSRGIGDKKLLELFNGKSYWIDGREYSIPREIWQKYIENKYKLYDIRYKNFKNEQGEIVKKAIYKGYSCYVGIRKLENTEKKIYNNLVHDKDPKLFRVELNKFENSAISYQRQLEKRQLYFYYRDNNPLYKLYLNYWKNKNDSNNVARPNEIQRILSLPDVKYWSYKQKALRAKGYQQSKNPFGFVPPRSNCHGFLPFYEKKEHAEKSFAPLSRHYTANDTIREKYREEFRELNRLRRAIMERDAQRMEISPF